MNREEYCLNFSTEASQVRKELAAHTRENVHGAGMLIGELEGAFFQFLLKNNNVRKVLEIGTYTGYSALTFAEVLPSNGSILTLDINHQTTAIAQSFWDKSEHGKKITAFVGDTHQKIESLIDSAAQFDFIFIDADKNNYPNYVKWGLQLVSPGGIIAVDNVLWNDDVLKSNSTDERTKNIRMACQILFDVPGFQRLMLPVRDGIMLAQKARE
jgi:caffeoyl-CoA O-methyltransferase